MWSKFLIRPCNSVIEISDSQFLERETDRYEDGEEKLLYEKERKTSEWGGIYSAVVPDASKTRSVGQPTFYPDFDNIFSFLFFSSLLFISLKGSFPSQKFQLCHGGNYSSEFRCPKNISFCSIFVALNHEKYLVILSYFASYVSPGFMKMCKMPKSAKLNS